MLKRAVAVNYALVVFLSGVFLSAFSATAQTNSPPLRARQLMGMKVEDSDGQKAGTVRNLVLNMNDGHLRYVVVASGGYLGVQAKLKLAPVQAISAATAKSETLALNVTTPHWKQAPVFKYSSLANLADPASAREVSRFFEISATPPADGNAHLATTGRESAAPEPPSPRLKLASDVMGMKVVNQKQEKIGEVQDLLVSLGESRPTFVIISTTRLFHHGRQYAVPLDALNRTDKKLELDLDATALTQAPAFDDIAWNSSGTSVRAYRYPTASQ